MTAPDHEQAERLTNRLGELSARVNSVTGAKVTMPTDDVRGLVEIAQTLAAQLAERERALERIRLAAGYETEDEDLRLAEVRSIVRAALDSSGGAER